LVVKELWNRFRAGASITVTSLLMRNEVLLQSIVLQEVRRRERLPAMCEHSTSRKHNALDIRLP